MRVSRVEIKGFRRLADTGTGIDGDLTAFVGFNEAGKTTFLEGLTWFTRGGPIAPVDYNRGRPPEDDIASVVKVFFELADDDLAAFSELPMDNRPKTLVLYRRRDGSRRRYLIPQPTRPAAPFKDAKARLGTDAKRLERQFAGAQSQEFEDPNDWANTLTKALASPDETWSEETTKALLELAAWLKETPQGLKKPRDEKLAEMLDSLQPLVTTDHPTEATWKILVDRVPAFVAFEDNDRELETAYEMQPDQRHAVHPAVSRLLSLAGIDIDDMWRYVEAGDSTKRETLLERGNDELRKLFDQAWNQSKVTVRFNVNGTRLEVLIKELHGDGDVTNISERSDGLKTFVALVAFLESGDYTVPPVLLIDE